MMKPIQISYTLDQIESVVQRLHDCMKHNTVLTLTGTLGAGKTTLVSHLLRSYGIRSEITSPTFTYVNVYTTDNGMTFYHFDLYRIGSLDEFLLAGFDEYLYQPNSIALVEWPAVIMPLLTHQVCHVTLEYGDDLNSRVMHVEFQ